MEYQEDQEEKRPYGLSTFLANARKNGVVRALGTDMVETFKSYIPGNMEKGKETTRQVFGGLVIAASAIGAIISPCIISGKIEASRRAGEATAIWDEYRGSIPGYTVSLEDSVNKNGGSSSIIHLNATDKSTVPNRITGHDYGLDGHIDRVFIMDKEFDACDSVSFIDGKAIWNPSPCSEREGKKPFTYSQIASAQAKLYEALSTVRTEDNQTRHFVAGMTEKDNWGIISK